MATVAKSTVVKKDKFAFAKLVEKMRDRDSELVTGIFENKENPRGSVTFSLKLYPGEEFAPWFFRDGERYTIPRGVARHLTNGCFIKEYGHMQGQFGETGMRVAKNDGSVQSNETMYVSSKRHRYAFRSLEFMDEDLDLFASNIAEVTSTPALIR